MYCSLLGSSLEFSRQEYWSRQPFPSLRDLPGPGIEAGPPAWQAVLFSFLPSGPPGEHWVSLTQDLGVMAAAATSASVNVEQVDLGPGQLGLSRSRGSM